MKKTQILFIALLLMSIITNAQIIITGNGDGTTGDFDPKGSKETKKLEAPNELKSNVKTIAFKDLTFISRYEQSVEGMVTVAFDNNHKVVYVLVPKSSGLNSSDLLNVNTSKKVNCAGIPPDLCAFLEIIELIRFR